MLEGEKKFESLCRRCGQCCGALDDPCEELVKVERDKYFCKSYENRLGRKRTLSGAVFSCVPIREHIEKGTLRPSCAYNGKLKQMKTVSCQTTCP